MDPAEYGAMHARELTHWWFRGRRRLLLSLLERHAPSTQGRPLRILDLGCGTGGNSAAYAAYGAVVGLEPDAGALRFASSRPGPSYCRGAGTALPFPSGSFDMVMASDVLEHIADDRAATREIARVLTPAGRLVFTVSAHPWLWSDHDRALWHQRRYRRRELVDVLAGAGLAPVWLSYWNATLLPVVAARRRLTPTAGGSSPRSDSSEPPRLPFVNDLLYALLALEAGLARRFALPWGVSLAGVAARRV